MKCPNTTEDPNISSILSLAEGNIRVDYPSAEVSNLFSNPPTFLGVRTGIRT